jgi:NADH:ubiquinone oxidoreductase subunit E
MYDKIKEIIEGFTRDRSNLVPMLYKIQDAENSLSPEAIAEISRYLDISENDTYSVASFYKNLTLSRS